MYVCAVENIGVCMFIVHMYTPSFTVYSNTDMCILFVITATCVCI